MSRFFYLCGYLNEGRERLTRLLDMTGPAASAALQTVVRAKALDAAGSLALFQWDHAAARLRLEESVAVWRKSDDRAGLGLSLNALGYLALDQGDYAMARAAFEERLVIQREAGIVRNIALSVSSLGSLALAEGGYVTARARFEESLAIWGESGDRGGIAFLLACFAELATVKAQPRRALQLAGVAAVLRQKSGTPLAPSLQVRLERTLESVRSAFSGEDAAVAWSWGATKSLPSIRITACSKSFITMPRSGVHGRPQPIAGCATVGCRFLTCWIVGSLPRGPPGFV